MPLILGQGAEDEQPKTYRFSVEISINVGNKFQTNGLQMSVSPVNFNGTRVFYIAASQTVDGAR
jgi:hypothetical protein